MDSSLAAFSRVGTDEKLCLQILLTPAGESEQSALKAEAEEVKTGKKKSFR